MLFFRALHLLSSMSVSSGEGWQRSGLLNIVVSRLFNALLVKSSPRTVFYRTQSR
jgi:hypothetical protein